MPDSSPVGGQKTRFERFELKLQLHPEDADWVREWARQNLKLDAYAGADATYSVHSLYLDTARLDIYHRNGDTVGTKFRIRRYGNEEVLWVERKRRKGTLVFKRRAAIPKAELLRVLEGQGIVEGWAKTFQDEVKTRQLVPTLLISYRRAAFVTERGSRLTLDYDIECRAPRLGNPFSLEPAPIEISKDVVLELKYDQTRPAIFDELMKILGHDPGSFSKYGNGVEAVGLAVSRRSGARPERLLGHLPRPTRTVL